LARQSCVFQRRALDQLRDEPGEGSLRPVVTAMSYLPRPGTVAWKALQHLETLQPGAEIMTSALAEAIGVEPHLIQPCMLSLIAAKMAYRRQKDEHARSPWWYSLTDHSKIPRAPVQRVAVPTEHTPQGANRAATGFEGRGPQGPDATDCKARSKVMSPEASASATGRGGNAPIARGAAPASMSASRAGPESDGSQKPNGRELSCSTGTAKAGSPSPEVGGLIDLHMVVRVTPQLLEQIVPLLKGAA
jgi:hypothetical protein